MPARKRNRQEAELDSSVAVIESTQDNPTLNKLRNMWQFAAFMQYLFLFGKVVKVDEDFDMDEFEMECLKPEPSTRLQEVGLALLKYVSSHRGLTMDIFDEYTRRQYEAKAPTRNPFGVEEEPAKFLQFDVFTKVRVLHQLSVWTLGNADRIRQQMPEQTEREQTSWRIEELGWDGEERAYYVLDDDRLYRRTDAPLPPTPKKAKAKPKSKSKKARGTRSSKRQKLTNEGEDDDEHVAEEINDTVVDAQQPAEDDDDFGGMKWECVAITLEQYQDVVESMRRSSDPDEKQLRKRILDDIMPIMEKHAEKQRQKALKRQRDLENLQKLATAKRSSRIAGRQEEAQKRAEEEAAEKQRLADLAMAKREEAKQRKMEEARESRMLTREQRLKEREVKRILHEEELKRLEENSKKMEGAEGRMSERNLKLEMEKRQKELDKLAEEQDEWFFDCSVCGVHGENLDDGTHSIACETCNIWQHSKCHGIAEADAESDDFHFICNDCIRKAEEAKKPKIPPLRLRMGASSSPSLDRAQPVMNGSHDFHAPPPDPFLSQPNQSPRPPPSAHRPLIDAPALSPQGQAPGPPSSHPHLASPVGVPQRAWDGATLPPPPRPVSAGYSSSPPRPHSHHAANGHAASPPPFVLHQQAHAGAVSNAHLPHQYQAYPQPNGNPNHMGPPSPQKGHSRPLSSYEPDARRTSLNGAASTPRQQHVQPLPALNYSPNTAFPPPNRPQQYQQAAGHSPTKVPSSSPAHAGPPNSTFFNTPSTTQPGAFSSATPQTQMSASHQNILRPSPGGPMNSSPIPPLPTGNTPLIPQKHDTPRPVSRDSIGPIPPGIKMSPSPATFARPGSSASGSPSPSNPLFSQSFGSHGASGARHSVSAAQNKSHDNSGEDNAAAGFPTVPHSESEQKESGQGEIVEDGGIAGVETDLGPGSVPVKKMQPQHSSPPRPSSATGFNTAFGGPAIVGHADFDESGDVRMEDS